jgi:uncharacterized protein YkuJ
MGRYLVLTLGLLILSIATNAQKLRFDTNYVHLTRQRFAVYPMAETAYLTMNFKDLNVGDGHESTLKSRTTTSLGFGVSFYRIGFSFLYQIPVTSIPELKNSKAYSFAGGYSLYHFYGELRYRMYNGFEEQQYLNDSLKGGLIVRKDIKLRQIGAVAYFFTAKKYNFDAAFKNYNVQKKSAVSFMLVGGGNRFDISGKYLFQDSTNFAFDITKVRDVDIYSFKLAPGIAFTLVFKGIYLSSILAVGANYNRLYMFGDGEEDFKTTFAPDIENRIVLGYNSNRWFGSLSFNLENDYFLFDKIDLSAMNIYFNIKMGYKFSSKYLGKLGKYL